MGDLHNATGPGAAQGSDNGTHSCSDCGQPLSAALCDACEAERRMLAYEDLREERRQEYRRFERDLETARLDPASMEVLQKYNRLLSSEARDSLFRDPEESRATEQKDISDVVVELDDLPFL